MISHGNYRSMLDMTQSVSVVAPNEITYLFLPLAHSFALLLQLGSFDIGASIAYWERDPLKIIPNLSEVRPHYLPLPFFPRIFEKIYMAATSAADKEGGIKKRIFWWRSGSASGCGRWSAAADQILLARQFKFADERVLSKIRGPVRRPGSAVRQRGRPHQHRHPQVLRRRRRPGARGLRDDGDVHGGDYLDPEDFKFGTVGRPFPGCRARKIADDGEVLIKGPNIFKGYYKNDEATEETVVDDWLHSGTSASSTATATSRSPAERRRSSSPPAARTSPRANLEAAMNATPARRRSVVIGDRRPTSRAGHARSRGRRRLRGRQRPARRPRRPRIRPEREGLDHVPRRPDQRQVRSRGAGQEDRDPPRRPLPGDGRADPDDEGQAERGGREVRREHQRALRVDNSG